MCFLSRSSVWSRSLFSWIARCLRTLLATTAAILRPPRKFYRKDGIWLNIRDTIWAAARETLSFGQQQEYLETEILSQRPGGFPVTGLSGWGRGEGCPNITHYWCKTECDNPKKRGSRTHWALVNQTIPWRRPPPLPPAPFHPPQSEFDVTQEVKPASSVRCLWYGRLWRVHYKYIPYNELISMAD